jgi:mono/diheme cytochrome c family protein
MIKNNPIFVIVLGFLGLGVLAWVFLTLPEDGSVQRGRALYTNYCANCHGDEGEGIKKLVPPMAHPYMLDPARIACAIHYGKKGDILLGDTLYNGWMLAFETLEVDQIRDIINYVNERWNKNHEWSPSEIPDIHLWLDHCR